MPEKIQNWNIKRLLEWSNNYLISKNVNQPRLSSELLLSSVLGYSRMELFLNFDYTLNPGQLAKFKEYVLKRVGHMPVQYILQEAYFRNLRLYVDRRVLIPRPETELLVDRALSTIFKNTFTDKLSLFFSEWEKKGSGTAGLNAKPGHPDSIEFKKMIAVTGDGLEINLSPFRILEVGTGSGAIALSIAQELEEYLKREIIRFFSSLKKEKDNEFIKDNVLMELINLPEGVMRNIKLNSGFSIIATENSAEALEVALKNAESVLKKRFINMHNGGLEYRADGYSGIIFYNADVIPEESTDFTEIIKSGIDLVVSNPPYIKRAAYKSLPAEVRDFEPVNALLAGDRGTEVYVNIIDRLENLIPGSCDYIFETDPAVVFELQELFEDKYRDEITNLNIDCDYNRRERIISFKYFKK